MAELLLILLFSCHPSAGGEDSAAVCSQGTCRTGQPLDGEVVPGVETDLACRVQGAPSGMELAEAVATWCAPTGTTYVYGNPQVDLQSCTDPASAQYWRALTTTSCCTDLADSHEEVWTEDGALLYSRDVDLMGPSTCCCGEAVAEVIRGSRPDLTCVPADPDSVCP